MKTECKPMKKLGSKISWQVMKFLLGFIWTNSIYILMCVMSLSDCETSRSLDLQMSKFYRQQSKDTNTYPGANVAAKLQALPAANNLCGKGYVLDLNNKCVKRFVPPKPKPCSKPYIRFGGHEMKIGGRMSEFWCEEGWKLAPSDNFYAMCKLGRWDRPIPNCVRPGCDELKEPPQVKLTYEMDGAIARFGCTKPWPELELIGEFVLSCDGQYWNATEPTCRKPPPTTTLSPTTNRQTSWDTSSTKMNTYTNIDHRTIIWCCVVYSIFIQIHVFLFH